MTHDERDLELAALPREAVPPPALEAAVVGELRRRGLLSSPTRWQRASLAAAAALLLFAGGLAAGRLTRPAARPAGPQYALLLYRGAEPEWSDAEVALRVGEVVSWMKDVRARGKAMRGEKLGDESRTLGEAPVTTSGPAELQGFFLVEAASLAEAEEVARSCPHLRHGGVIVVKPVVRT